MSDIRISEPRPVESQSVKQRPLLKQRDLLKLKLHVNEGRHVQHYAHYDVAYKGLQ